MSLFDWHDDSRGLRYLPTRYYVQLWEFKGGLTYTRWFSKNFPDDVGFPDFLFEWTLLLFQNAKRKEAEQKAVETFCADRQLFDHFLARPVTPAETWEEAPLAATACATYFASLGQPNRSGKVCAVASRLAGHGTVFGTGGAVSARAPTVAHGAERRKTAGARQPTPKIHLCPLLALIATGG